MPSLARLLSHLSPKEPFSTIIPGAQRPTYLNALIWLLRNQLVTKQRTFVRILASTELKQATAAHWDRTALQSGISLASSSRPDDASQLSTSAGAASEHSFGASSRRSDGSKLPRPNLSSSTRPDYDDTRGMVIVSGSAVSGGSPRDALLPASMALSQSQKSASMFATRMADRRRRPTGAGPGTGTRSQHSGSGFRKGFSTATMSSQSERPDETSSTPSVIVEPGQPSMLESRWLNEMCRDKESSLVGKFER